MKTFLLSFLFLVVGAAYADNTITSKEYIDTQVSNLQTQIPAKNTNTVVTNTGTAGTVGERAIYDTMGTYAEQQNALVDAQTFNAAVQNALDTEFVCVEWQGDVHDNAHCLLYEVRGAAQTQTLPSGYTQLEYLESTGTQYIDTGITSTNNVGMSVKYAWTELQSQTYIFGSYNPHYYLGITTNSSHAGAYGAGAGNVALRAPIASVSTGTIYQYDINLYNSGTVQFVGLTPVTTLEPKTFGTNSVNIWLFSTDGGGYASKSRIYYVQITDGSSLVRNFIPARRDSDGVLGMYDTVSNTFFTNSGTGEFIAGPVASYLPQGN